MTRAGFATLAAAYQDRLGALAPARAAGRPVVGYVGNTVPVELIAACGALALRIAPVEGDTAAADDWIEAFADRDARLIAARYVEGVYDALALLVIPRSSETWHKLYLALREAQRTGRKTGGPPLWLHDVPHTQRDSSRRYGLARSAELAMRLTQATGRVADDAALRAAIAQANRSRRLLQQLQAHRAQARVAGWQAQVATGALRFLAPDDGEQALAHWLHDDPRAPAPGARLAVIGVPLDHAGLHALVEAAGGQIVTEDDDWGARAATPLVDESAPPMDALFTHYWREVPCARIHPPPPGPPAFVAAHRRGDVDGVLFNLPRPDDVYGWQLPAWRAAAAAAGLPALCLRDDARDPAARARLAAALQAFIAPLADRRP